jgi:HNH endonuclease/AP2 domain
VTPERLRQVLDYNPSNGVFVWRVTASNRAVAGSVAGNKSRKGYIRIRLGRREFLAHRLAWLYVYGVWPVGQIDHHNELKSDNRIDNLRDATGSWNQHNITAPQRNNVAGFRGVSWRKNKWVAQIMLRGRSIHLGRFNCAEDAHAAYVAAKDAACAG